MPMSASRVRALAAELVCRVLKTRCPVKLDLMATSAVSPSRISPIITTSGSCRSTLRRALWKLTLSAESTSTWATPEISYSIGSSMVMMFCGSWAMIRRKAA